MPGLVQDPVSKDMTPSKWTLLKRLFGEWLKEEEAEPEHQNGVVPDSQGFVDASNQDHVDPPAQPALVRTRTTTVSDYTPPAGGTAMPSAPPPMAVDPLTSKGEKIKSAMTDQYGPEKGEQVFYASKNKGTISGVDEDEDERFALSPDGQHIIDKQGGTSYSIEDAMRILFSDGKDSEVNVTPQTVGKGTVETAKTPTGTVNVHEDDTMQGGQLGPEQGWNSPQWPPQKDNGLGDGKAGNILGSLVKYAAGESSGESEDCMDNGRSGSRGWRSPSFDKVKGDAGTSEGAKKAAQTRTSSGGSSGYDPQAPSSIRAARRESTARAEKARKAGAGAKPQPAVQPHIAAYREEQARARKLKRTAQLSSQKRQT